MSKYPVELMPFWFSTPLDDLAALQGILNTSADDLDSISALWPVDDDPDELLNHILSERAGRGITRSEACAIARQTLDRAERERREQVEQDAKRGVSWE